MPAAPPPFPFRTGEVVLGADGEIASVIAYPGGPAYLIGGGRVGATIDGRQIDWAPTDTTVDVDEVELRDNLADGVTVTVRHSFAAGWGVRLVLGNETDEPIAVEARLSWVPNPAGPAWALSACATGGYAIPAPDGAGPLLGGELTRGSFAWVDPEWIGLDLIELPALGRYVVQWQWDWFPTPARFERGRFVSVPRQLVLRTGEIARITAGDDEAVVARGVDLTRVGGEWELTMNGPAQVPVRVSSARGVTAYDLTWVDPTQEVLAELGTSLVPGRLDGVDAALAVQHVLARGEADDRDAAEDALDRFTGRLLDAAPAVSSREIGYLSAEFERTGEAEVLDAAAAGLLGVVTPMRGVGLAATHLCVAAMVAGRPVADLLDHLAGLATTIISGPAGLVDLAARLELLAVGPGRGAAADRSVSAEVEALLDRIGPILGAGLRGRPVRPRPVDDLAHLAVVLGVLPEAVGAPIRRGWGMSPHALARKTEAEVIARLAGGPPRAAHGWLTLGQRLG